MTVSRSVLILGALVLLAAIIRAMARASFGASFAAITADPWGLVTLIDLYLGFFVAAAVIGMVERPFLAMVWIVAMLTLGNLVSAVWLAIRLPYLAGALKKARQISNA